MTKHLLLLALLTAMFGCAPLPQVIRTGADAKVNVEPTAPNSVDVYRSSKPKGDYFEIGIITLRGHQDLPSVFEKFRAEAGKNGANAIIDFDIDSKSVVVTETETRTDPEGNTYTVTHDEVVVYQWASGTLVRTK